MNAELAHLVGKFPTPGGDRKLASPNKQDMDEAIVRLIKLGRGAIVGLVDLLVDPSQATDTQVRHALHALATYVAGQPGDDPRREIAQALASTLDGDRPKEAKGFVIRQLQVCGGREVIDALGKQLMDEELSADAAQAMLAIGARGDSFRQPLAHAKGKRHRLTLIQSLGVLVDPEVADVLRAAARDDDRDIRQASLWGLANIGQPDDVELLISAASAAGYERTQATQSCLLLAERLLAGGRQQPAAKIYRHLRDAAAAPEYVREAAERGLAAANSRWLFNGENFAGWQNASGKPPSGWIVQDGAMVCQARSGDIWTIRRFGDFVLELEFKTAGNSGIFIRTDKPTDNVQTGIEIQVDNPSAKPGKHSCGAIYDCLAPRKEASKPGQWNHVVITAQNSRITVAMNGEPIIDMDLDQWSQPHKNPDGSQNKFRTPLKDFKREGHIGFQDHGAIVMYRHVKLTPLDGGKVR